MDMDYTVAGTQLIEKGRNMLHLGNRRVLFAQLQ